MKESIYWRQFLIKVAQQHQKPIQGFNQIHAMTSGTKGMSHLTATFSLNISDFFDLCLHWRSVLTLLTSLLVFTPVEWMHILPNTNIKIFNRDIMALAFFLFFCFNDASTQLGPFFSRKDDFYHGHVQIVGLTLLTIYTNHYTQWSKILIPLRNSTDS